MSKFLTPPVWYDKNGNLNEMLTGNATTSRDIVIGSEASADGGGIAIDGSAETGGIAIGGDSSAHAGIAIGPYAYASTSASTAIGRYASAGATRTVAIGTEASATASNTIQLGGNSVAYTLSVGNGRMSLNIGSTAEGNWVSAKSSGISQGLYLVKYGEYINTVYLMAPVAFTNPFEGGTSKIDWYFPFNISPFRINTGSSNIIVTNSYYLKVDKNSTASNLQITPGYYKYDSGTLPGIFQSMSDGSSVMLFKIL